MKALLIAAAATLLIGANAPPPPAPNWLAGAWAERTEAGWTEEYWTPMRGHVMIGAGFAGAGEKLRHWEQMRIERSADGTLTFWASPKGAPAVSFPATSVQAGEITFTNPAHDYPQRVHYRREGETLKAEISLADGAKATRWTYRRMSN